MKNETVKFIQTINESALNEEISKEESKKQYIHFLDIIFYVCQDFYESGDLVADPWSFDPDNFEQTYKIHQPLVDTVCRRLREAGYVIDSDSVYNMETILDEIKDITQDAEICFDDFDDE